MIGSAALFRRGHGPAALLAGLLIAGCGGPAPAPAPERAPAPPPPSGPRLYVTDEPGGNVIAIDATTGQVIEHIQVGKRPRGIRISRDGKQLLVALSGSPIAPPGTDESKLPPPDRKSDGIGLVDLSTHKLLKVIPGGQDPESFDLSLDGGSVFVSNEDAAEMSVLDLANGAVTHHVKIGLEPEGVTLRPDGKVVYVTCEGDNEVFAIDTTSYKVLGKMAAGNRPRSVAFTSDNKIAFVTGETSGTVTVIDAEKHRVLSTIKVTGAPGVPAPKDANGKDIVPRPMGLAMTDDNTKLYVSNGRAKSISVIDVAARKLLQTFEDVGTRPWGIAVSADGKKVYTANGPAGDVSVIDAATGAVEKKISVGGGPWGVVITK